jgi:hypothetical protein
MSSNNNNITIHTITCLTILLLTYQGTLIPTNTIITLTRTLLTISLLLTIISTTSLLTW